MNREVLAALLLVLALEGNIFLLGDCCSSEAIVVESVFGVALYLCRVFGKLWKADGGAGCCF